MCGGGGLLAEEGSLMSVGGAHYVALLRGMVEACSTAPEKWQAGFDKRFEGCCKSSAAGNREMIMQHWTGL